MCSGDGASRGYYLLLQHLLAGAQGLLLGLADSETRLAVLQLATQAVYLALLVPAQPDQVVPVLLVVLSTLRFARFPLQQACLSRVVATKQV